MAISVQHYDNEISVNLYHYEPADNIQRDRNLAANHSYFQPCGDRGAGSAGSLQDSHRHLSPGHGGRQPEALVPGQQVRFQIAK